MANNASAQADPVRRIGLMQFGRANTRYGDTDENGGHPALGGAASSRAVGAVEAEGE